MKVTLFTLATLLAGTSARPQAEGGAAPDPAPAPAPAPVVDPISSVAVEIITVTAAGPAPTTPISNQPVPEPAPPAPPVSQWLPAPLPSIPVNPDGPVPTPPSPVPDPDPTAGGANCVCGATYCGKVLVGFQGYTTEALGTSYCATPNSNCALPPSPDSLENTLFVCICNPGEKKGSQIELLCPCQGRCKNDEPDFIGRCETPCNLGCAPAASAAPVPLPEPVPVAPAPPAKKGRHL
ncbi:hypothetical protein CkaCkLH20_07527 [Colletotrichum karsti]|uniref:Filamentous hemagglutinin n=1 Tax=Colletotrichum karsti TaxID=1095194 RepID=A0A9P6I1P6_9PEZI|nr:uncharacterized protein CkaCkLH20_07527 [Colletotrichum karsti]KAF9874833.1 hypothetical protein CkaCkLH20_07527 [Colletotrichum karsti]